MGGQITVFSPKKNQHKEWLNNVVVDSYLSKIKAISTMELKGKEEILVRLSKSGSQVVAML